MTRPLSNIDPELLRWATDREKEYIAALEEFGGAAAGGRHLGVSKSVIARAMQSLKKRAALQGARRFHLLRPRRHSAGPMGQVLG
jgi:hypothetical protein